MADLTGAAVEVRVAWMQGSSAPDAAERLLLLEVGRAARIPAGEVSLGRMCVRCGSSEHGRPFVVRRDGEPAPFVSLGRAEAAVIVAVCDAEPVGVDLERIDAARFAGFGDVALHPAERAPGIEERALIWARKESLLKATGEGLHADPRLIRVSDPGRDPRVLQWSGRAEVPAVQMRDVEIPGYAACLTVLTEAALGVTTRQVAPEALSD